MPRFVNTTSKKKTVVGVSHTGVAMAGKRPPIQEGAKLPKQLPTPSEFVTEGTRTTLDTGGGRSAPTPPKAAAQAQTSFALTDGKAESSPATQATDNSTVAMIRSIRVAATEAAGEFEDTVASHPG